MVDLSQYNTAPIDVSGLTGISNQLNQGYDQYNQIFSKNMENLNTSRQQYLDLIKRLQSKEDNASTGNPFIDLLNGYKNMKKQQDPNYQWQGLVGMLANKRMQGQNDISPQALPYSNAGDGYVPNPNRYSAGQGPMVRPNSQLMPSPFRQQEIGNAPDVTPNMDLISQMRSWLASPKSRGK